MVTQQCATGQSHKVMQMVESSNPPRRVTVRRARERAEILDAAALVFRRRGYGAATVEDIAGELGIVKGSLYHYIRSKQELLYEIAVEPLRAANQAIDDASAIDGPVEHRIRQAVISHIAVIHDQYPRLSISLLERLELPPEQLAEIKDLHNRYQERWRDLLASGVSTGLLRADIDLGLTTLGILGMLNWATQWYRPDGRAGPAEIGAEFATLALQGILARPAG